MGVVVSSSYVVSVAPQGEDSSCSSSSSYAGQFRMNCSRVGPFHEVQSFRNRLLQCGFPMGSQALPANLLRCGLLSPRVHGKHGFPMGSQPPLGICLLQHGVLHGLQAGICSTMDLHGLQGDSPPHHSPHHGLQGNLCSGTWSTSSPSFFTDLGVCTAVSLTSSHSSLPCCFCTVVGFFPHFLNVLSQRCYHHQTGEQQVRLGAAWH